MFEKELEQKFQQIFGVKKVTFDAPSSMKEQDCIFIDIENADNFFEDKKCKSKITGNAFMISRNTKIPFGFFQKAIDKADADLTKDLFFYDLEVNTTRYRDLVQRGFSFIYFFSGQYDPDVGTINSADITVEEQS